jgi:hypothetical protein
MIGDALRTQNLKTSIPLQRLARLLPCHFRSVSIFYTSIAQLTQELSIQISENIDSCTTIGAGLSQDRRTRSHNPVAAPPLVMPQALEIGSQTK